MKRILAISLAFLTLTLSLNVGFAFHYCGGDLAKYKMVLGYGSVSCEMKQERSCCEKNHSNDLYKKFPCCEDALKLVTTDDYYPVKFFNPSLDIGLVVPQLAFNTDKKEYKTEKFIRYKPPPLITDVSLTFIEVFLI